MQTVSALLSKRNLRRMVRFAELFPDLKIVSTLSTQFSWSHYSAELSFRAYPRLIQNLCKPPSGIISNSPPPPFPAPPTVRSHPKSSISPYPVIPVVPKGAHLAPPRPPPLSCGRQVLSVVGLSSLSASPSHIRLLLGRVNN